MKTVSLWTLALLILAAPVLAEAHTVTIKLTRTVSGTTTTATPAATTTFTDSAGKFAVALACTSNVAGVANSTAGTAACSRTITIPSSPATTVTIRDVSATSRARVYRDDGLSSDILNVAGLLVTSGSGITATTGVTLTITYASASTDFTPLNYNLYAYTAATSGNFFTASGTKASACATATSTTPCLTLKLTANNVTVNQFGDNAIATVNVPPTDSAGGFGPPNNPSETKSVACGTSGVNLSCKPSLQGELTAIFKGSSETLKVLGGAAVGQGKSPIWAGGVKQTAVDVAEPEFVGTPGTTNFVRYDQDATLHATLVQDGQLFPKAGGSGQMPLWWNLEKVDEHPTTPPSSTPVHLRSIVSNADLFDDGAYLSWVPTSLAKPVQARDLTLVAADFTWVGACSSANLNAFFVEIELETLQVIKVLLGCGSLSTQNLVTSPGVIVKLPNDSTTDWKGMLNQFGGVNIRAISVFLSPIAGVDQQVDLASFTIGAFKQTFTQGLVQPASFTNDVECDNFPGLNEFTVRATPVDVNGEPVGPPFIWGAAPGQTFTKVEGGPTCQLQTAIPINVFPPMARQNAWRFDLMYNLVPSGFGTMLIANNN